MNSLLKKQLKIHESNLEAIEKSVIEHLRSILEKLSNRLNENKLIVWSCGMGIESLEIQNTNIITSVSNGIAIFKSVLFIHNGCYVQDTSVREKHVNRMPELKEFYDLIESVEDVIGRDKVYYGSFEIRGKR